MSLGNKSMLSSKRIKNVFQEFWPIFVILLIAGSFYLYQIGAESLWVDELSSILVAKRTPSEIWMTNRPTYFILLHYWIQLGQSEAWLRGLSCFFGIGSVFLTYLLGRLLAGNRTGLVSALLLALSPLFINHAQEVRMYTVGTFWCLLGSLGLAHLVLERNRFNLKSGFIWIGSRLVMFWAAPLNISIIFADFFIGLLSFRNQKNKVIRFLSFLLLFSLFAIPKFLQSYEKKGDVLNTWAVFNTKPGLFSIAGMMTRFSFWARESSTDIRRLLLALLLVTLIVIALFLKPRSSYAKWLIMWAFIPQGAVFIVSHFTSSLWIERYLLFTAPYIFIVLANGLLKCWQFNRKIGFALVVIYAIGSFTGISSYYNAQMRPDWRGVAQHIYNAGSSTDSILLFGLSRDYSKEENEKSRDPNLFEYYYSGPSTLYTYDAFPSEKVVDELEIKSALQKALPLPSRSWLIYERTAFFAPENARESQHKLFESIVYETFSIGEVRHFTGVDVFLLEGNSKK